MGFRCAIRNGLSARVSSVVCSSQGIRGNATFIYLGNCASSKRECTGSTIRGNTSTLIVDSDLSFRIPDSITIMGISSAECTLSLVDVRFFKRPRSRLCAITVANAGNGAAAATVITRVFRRTKVGANAVKALNIICNKRARGASGAAPRSCVVRGSVHSVVGTNYGTVMVRTSSVKLGRDHLTNVAFSINVFAGFSSSRVNNIRRGSLTRCLCYGDLLFERYGFTTTGVSSPT